MKVESYEALFLMRFSLQLKGHRSKPQTQSFVNVWQAFAPEMNTTCYMSQELRRTETQMSIYTVSDGRRIWQ